jgi:hypothetical protein
LTSETRVIDVPGVTRFEIAPHQCFACGTLNTSGMGLSLHVKRELRERYGWRPVAGPRTDAPDSVDMIS